MAALLSRIFRNKKKKFSSPLLQQSTIKKRQILKKSVNEAEYVVFDTELTGLDFKNDSLVSIGAIKLKGSTILPGKTFYRLVKPDSELKHQSIVVHEITPVELTYAEEPDKVVEEFLSFIGGAVLVGHFVHIDVNFVNRSLKKHYGIALKNPAVDTACLHDWLIKNDPNFTRHYGGITSKKDLFSLAKKYDIKLGKFHNAFWDAYITAQLFQKFLSFLPQCGIKTVKELHAIGK